MSLKDLVNKGCQRQVDNGTEHPEYEQFFLSYIDIYHSRCLRYRSPSVKYKNARDVLFGTQLCSLLCWKEVSVVF